MDIFCLFSLFAIFLGEYCAFRRFLALFHAGAYVSCVSLMIFCDEAIKDLFSDD